MRSATAGTLARRVKHLEARLPMNTTDWRDACDGLIPSPRWLALVDWLADDQLEELRATLHAIPPGTSLEDDTVPAVAAYGRHLAALYQQWTAAGQPDPRGRMLHPPHWRQRRGH